MLAVQDLWKLIEPVVRDEGLALYDIEFGGSGTGGTLRVTLWKGDALPSESSSTDTDREDGQRKESGIGIDHCTSISRKISALDRFEDILPGKTTLEVSSPGINRRLRRREHFVWAIGERVRLQVLKEGKEQTVVGTLVSLDDDDMLSLMSEGSKKAKEDPENMVVRLEDVTKARVDFLF